jgi:hypothetical protein
MGNKFSQLAKKFFTPETLPPFLFGAIVLSVLGNAVTTILFNLIGNSTTPSAIAIIIGTMLIFAFCVWTIAKLSERVTPAVDLDKAPPDRHRGLILLVSREEPCRQAISYHLPTLECCWLICSNQTLTIAQDLKAEFPNVNIPEPWVIHDIYDPVEFNQVIRKIYENLPPKWTVEDVIADFTGMTAQGSVGMVLASAFFPKIKFQYTPAELKDGKPTGRSLTPIGISVR